MYYPPASTLVRRKPCCNGLARRSGLAGGLDPPSADCPQPVHTNERDALRNEIKGWTSPYKGSHFHEGHPDIKAFFLDVQKRLAGLEHRPKLLRCSREARHRATTWIASLEALRRKASRIGTSSRPGAKATSWIRVDAPFQWSTYRVPTYTIRPGVPHPEAFADLSTPESNVSASAPTPPAQLPAGGTATTAPPGSVVIDGVVYTSSAAARQARQASTPAPAPGAPGPGPGPASFAGGGGGMPGTVAGIPTQYLLYGAIGLVALKAFK